MAYDIYGNYTPDQETEEERKKREQAAANAEVSTQKVTTYGDGSQTHTTTTEVPSPGSQAQRFPPAGPVAPSAVNYGLSTGQEQPGLQIGRAHV